MPLQPRHIDSVNYLYWAGKYRAEGVEPPPLTQVLSESKIKDNIQPDQDTKVKLASDSLDVVLTDGYRPLCACVNVYGETQAGVHAVMVQIQDQQLAYVEPWEVRTGPFRPFPSTTGKIPVTINTARFYNCEIVVSVFCVRSRERCEAWQIKTYNSIMNASNEQKSRYDDAIAAARVQASDTQISGTNPAANR